MNNPEIETLKQKYIDTLSPKEKKAYLIAKDHLGMSFQLEKSVGFREWYKQTKISSAAAAAPPL